MVGKFLDEDALNGVGAASAALTTLEGSVEETEEGLWDKESCWFKHATICVVLICVSLVGHSLTSDYGHCENPFKYCFSMYKLISWILIFQVRQWIAV